MSSIVNNENKTKWKPSVLLGIILYLGYLAIFFATWTVNKVDYTRIGENADTTKLWYALPTLFGSLFLVIAISVLKWWRIVLFDKRKAGPKWIWILPIAMLLIIINNFANLNVEALSIELILWSGLGALGVGFGEEMITRGSMVVGLRSQFSEWKVWLYSTLLFSALHIPNVIFGLPISSMPIQVILTFIIGSGFYIIRRVSGTLIIPMILHGLWDSSLFITDASGGTVSPIQLIIYPLAIVCVFVVLFKNRETKVN